MSLCSFRGEMTFVQNSRLAVSATLEHCIMELDLEILASRPYAGKCGESGNSLTIGGAATESHMSYVMSLAYDTINKWLYAGFSTKVQIIRIRSTDGTIHDVLTSSKFFMAQNFALNEQSQTLLFTRLSEVCQLSVDGLRIKPLFTTITLRPDDACYPSDLSQVNGSTLLVTDMIYRRRVVGNFGFCHSPVDIRASARAGVCAREREWARVKANRRQSMRENQQQNGKNCNDNPFSDSLIYPLALTVVE